MAVRLAVTLAAVVIAAPAQAEPRNGDDLLRYCTATIGAYMLYCFGYVGAVADSLIEGGQVAGFDACPPSGIDDPRLRDRVVTFLKDNPMLRSRAAAELAARALHEAFPCPPL